MIESIEKWIIAWDRTTFFAINNGWKCDFLDAVMPRISDLGLGHVQVAAILIVAVILSARSGRIQRIGFRGVIKSVFQLQKRWLVPVLIAWALGGLTSNIIKSSITRDRPWWFYMNQQKLGRELDRKVAIMPSRPPIRVRGFPSGHTTTSVAILFTATLLLPHSRRKRLAVLAGWVVTFGICISRVYISDHWPLDIAGGAVLGVVSGWVAVRISSRLFQTSSDSSQMDLAEPSVTRDFTAVPTS